MRYTPKSRRNDGPGPHSGPGPGPGRDHERTGPEGTVRAPTTLPAAPVSAPPGSLDDLQRTYGNAAVARMIEGERNRADADQGHDAVREAVRTAGRGGTRLPGGMRATMERAFGADLGHLRVSVDARTTAAIDAKAYTVGDNIVVQNASVLRDVGTMAHEIHHTTQRGAPAGLSDPGDRWEREAAEVGDRVARGGSAHPHATTGGEDRGNGAGHRDAVQRRVGFEFESQWRMRDHNDLTQADEESYQNEIVEREAVRHAQIMVTLAGKSADAKRLLDETEQSASEADLMRRWLTPAPPDRPYERRLTDEGAGRLRRLRQEAPDTYEQLMADGETALLRNNAIRETPIPGRDVPKMGVVGGGTKYQLTSDVSPTGGSALEWVTDPLDSKDEVVEVMNTITKVSSALDARQAETSFPLDGIRVAGFEAQSGIMVFPLRGPLLYEPQTTGGFKLDQLPRFLEYLEVPKKPSNPFKRPAHRQRKQAGEDLHRTALTKVTKIRLAAEELAKGLPRESIGDASTDGLVGLVSLIGSYLHYGAKLEENPNSKSIAGGLMSRTSFAHNFALLPGPLQAYFREDPNRFVAFALRAVGFPEDGSAQLYAKPVARGDAGDRETKQITLTRAEWLKGIPAGKDLLRNFAHLNDEEKEQVGDREEEWDYVHPSLGKLGTVEDQVGRPGEQELALVAELRRMKQDIPTAAIKPFALAAFGLIQRLNERKTLKYKKK
ncbi:DUF4157 domain-containing protein [Streptomyces sp. NPDC059913]|uniref:eCIS core domain-containing protein n=1 Tax=unclassified Streptomyces TaxID=2593676 RepID=UPI00364AADCD